jgi:hypothetical protein
MGKQVLAASDVDIIVHPNEPSYWEDRQAFSLQGVKELWERSATSNHYLLPRGTSKNPTLELIIDYGAEGPAIGANQTKTIQVKLINLSSSAIKGKLSLDLPEEWVGPDALEVFVQSNENIEWTVDITASDLVGAYHELALLWTRIHDHAVWATERVTFSLIGSSRWTLWGPKSNEGIETMFAGNRLEWEKVMDADVDGYYRAVTTLFNPSERQVRLNAAANSPILLRLNGKIVIDCKQTPEFMPAYHRAPNDQWIELTLAAGSYELDVTTLKNGVPLQVYILPVATMNTTDPGPCYYYTDMLFGGFK